MPDLNDIRSRLAHWETALAKLQEAYIALVDGRVKSYTINDRSLTRLDLPTLSNEIREAERKVDQYKAMLNGGRPRKAFRIVPVD